jgi:hypothetical protein
MTVAAAVREAVRGSHSKASTRRSSRTHAAAETAATSAAPTVQLLSSVPRTRGAKNRPRPIQYAATAADPAPSKPNEN